MRETADRIPVPFQLSFPKGKAGMTRKIIFTLSLGFLFLIAVASAGKNTSNKTPVVISKQVKGPGQTRAGSRKKKRRPASDKEDILGPNYDAPPDSAKIRKRINSLLNKPAELCNTNESFDRKARSLERILGEIRRAVQGYLKNPYLTIEDGVYLDAIEDNISKKNLSMGQPLTGSFLKSAPWDLRRQFARNYALYYGIGDDIGDDVEAFRFSHEWAEKIYKGILCLYKDSG